MAKILERFIQVIPSGSRERIGKAERTRQRKRSAATPITERTIALPEHCRQFRRDPIAIWVLEGKRAHTETDNQRRREVRSGARGKEHPEVTQRQIEPPQRTAMEESPKGKVRFVLKGIANVGHLGCTQRDRAIGIDAGRIAAGRRPKRRYEGGKEGKPQVM